MTLSAEQVVIPLFEGKILNPQATYFIAYSGGVDSTVLLHMMSQASNRYGFRLIALHVNHNMNSASGEWAEHCERVCQSLNVEFRCTELFLQEKTELAARTGRYNWFRDEVGQGNVLMTAHHRQDRAETFLFNLMRGAGSSGLSSLRHERPFFGSRLIRPLVRHSQEDVLAYAHDHQLIWVEDPSNESIVYSRNQIRKLILPTLTAFREDAERNIARAAQTLEQENSLLREIAISDLVDIREYPKHPLDNSHALCYDDMTHLSRARKANLVRFWLASLQIHVPSKRLMDELLDCFESNPSSTTILQEEGKQFRFYKGFLYAMPELNETQPFQSIDWMDLSQPVDLFHQRIRIDATPKLREYYLSNGQACHLRVVSRPEVINPKALQGHSLNLKKWMQDIGVPPWRRQGIPLLTLKKSDRDTVITPVDQQLHSDWLSLECPVGW